LGCAEFSLSWHGRFKEWMWFDISPVFTDFSNSGVEYLAFLSNQGEKMVSSEPSNLRKK
jgi:hypothetical protein